MLEAVDRGGQAHIALVISLQNPEMLLWLAKAVSSLIQMPLQITPLPPCFPELGRTETSEWPEWLF